MIKPTVGRIVWYRPSPGNGIIQTDAKQPLAAMITAVWTDACVNLVVFDANGYPHSRTSVPLAQAQDDDSRPAYGFCEWMPYQKGQAAKTEAVEAKLAGGA